MPEALSHTKSIGKNNNLHIFKRLHEYKQTTKYPVSKKSSIYWDGHVTFEMSEKGYMNENLDKYCISCRLQ